MKLSYGGQCGRNGFMAYIGSGNRPVLSASHAGCIVRTNLTPIADNTLPQRIPCGLHLTRGSATSKRSPLPQRIPCGLHPSFLYTLPIDCAFASAHPMRVASYANRYTSTGRYLCLSASHAGCILIIRSNNQKHRHFASAHPMRVASEPLEARRAGTRSLPQRIPCGLHHHLQEQGYQANSFASAHPMRVASAKMHKIHSMDL